MLNRKLFFSLVALVGFGLFFTLNGFKNTAPIQYQYTSNATASSEIKNIDNWEEVDGNTPGCGNEGNLVCRYEFDGDLNAFETFLNSSSTTPQSLLDGATATKQ